MRHGALLRSVWHCGQMDRADQTPADDTPRVMTVAQIKAAEARTMKDTPESVLMDAAANGVAIACKGLLARHGITLVGCRIVVLAGSGNNGGDALLAGALLARQGADVVAVGVGERGHERGSQALRDAGGAWHDATTPAGLQSGHDAVASARLVIDGIVGIGSRPGLREPAPLLVAAMPENCLVVAVDVPSGLDADSGPLPDTYVRADLTVTFTAHKPCLVLLPARTAAGRVKVVDVGVEARV